MAQQVVGTLTKIGERAWNNKTMYSIFVRPDGESQDVMIGLGLDQCNVPVNSRVSVKAETNAKGYLTCKAKDIQKVEQQAAAQSGGGNGKSGSFADRQSSIVLQSSYKTATDQANALLAAGLWKPAANSKAAKQNAVDAYFAFVDQVAVQLFEKCMNPDDFLDSYMANLPPEGEDNDDSDNPFGE